jgi:thioredoxin-related protein
MLAKTTGFVRAIAVAIENAGLRVWLARIGFLVLTGPVLAEPPDGYPFVNFDRGLQLAGQSGKAIMVYYGRLGCGWCDKTNREAFSNPDLRALYIKNYELVYVDTESGNRVRLPNGERLTEHDLAARMQVLATPLFVWLRPDGREIMRVPGIQTTRDFLMYDRFVAGGVYEHESFRDFLAREARQ